MVSKWVQVFGLTCSVTAAAVILSASSCDMAPPGGLQVTIKLPAAIVEDGKAFNLTAEVSNAQGDVKYQWMVNETPGARGAVGSLTKQDTATATYDVTTFPDNRLCDAKLDIKLTVTDGRNTPVSAPDKQLAVSSRWCTYRKGAGPGTPMISDLVTRLSLQPGGSLWVGTDRGLQRFIGLWSAAISEIGVDFKLGNVAGGQRKYVNALLATPDGVFVSACDSATGEACVLQKSVDSKINQNANYVSWDRPRGAPEGYQPHKVLKNDIVRSMAYHKGVLLVGTKDGVSFIDPKTNLNVEPNFRYLGQWVNAIARISGTEDSTDSELWFGTGANFRSGEGIYTQQGIQGAQSRIDGSQWKGTGVAFNNTDIRTIAAEGNHVFIGLHPGAIARGGMVMRQPDPDNNGAFMWQLFTTSDSSGMPSNDIRKIVSGSGGVIWVATDKGLASFKLAADGKSGNWGPYTSRFTKPFGGLETDDINDLAYDSTTDTLWIATNGGGLTRLRAGFAN